MPLIQSKSNAARSQNIATEIRAGKDPKQAAAIAYSEQRKNMAEGGDAEPDDMDSMLDQVADEFIQAVETKDKKMLLDALECLVSSIQSADEKQDKELP